MDPIHFSNAFLMGMRGPSFKGIVTSLEASLVDFSAHSIQEVKLQRQTDLKKETFQFCLLIMRSCLQSENIEFEV